VSVSAYGGLQSEIDVLSFFVDNHVDKTDTPFERLTISRPLDLLRRNMLLFKSQLWFSV